MTISPVLIRQSGWFALGLLVMLTDLPPVWAQSPEAAIEAAAANNQAAAQTQQNIDALATQTVDMAEDYRHTLAQLEDLRAYNNQTEKLLADQQAELASLTQQAETAGVTQQRIVPLLTEMVAALAKLIELDIPFLPSERGERLLSLQSLLDRADVALPEKYRRVMEAYQVEAEYGRTIEAYTGKLTAADDAPTVNFLRIGRMTLLYASLDGNQVGRWNPDTKAFEELPGDYRQALASGLQIARKETTPDLIKVPLPAPETAVTAPATAAVTP